jgi:hypothetical protein
MNNEQMKTIINPPPNCENCSGQTEWFQPNFAYKCYFCGNLARLDKQPTRQQIKKELERIKGK